MLYVKSIVLFLLLFIVGYFVKKRRKKKKDYFKAKDNDVDLSSVFDDIYKSKELYKKLSRKYHPDRFVNTENYQKAEEIFKELNQYQRNHSKLLEIEKYAKTELG